MVLQVFLPNFLARMGAQRAKQHQYIGYGQEDGQLADVADVIGEVVSDGAGVQHGGGGLHQVAEEQQHNGGILEEGSGIHATGILLFLLFYFFASVVPATLYRS